MDLFKGPKTTTNHITGLRLISDYITVEQEQALLSHIDNQNWLTDLKRRVQHYGYKYDYKARAITNNLKLGNIPDWLSFMQTVRNRKTFCKKNHIR